MEYHLIPQQRRFRGPVHWGHTISLYCKENRLPELREFLDEVIGKDQWRIARKYEGKPNSPYNWLKEYRTFDRPTRIKFLKKDHAVRVKLMWDECEKGKDGIHFLATPPKALHKLYMNSMWGFQSSGKTNYIRRLFHEKVRETGEENLEKFECIFDHEARFNIDSINIKADSAQ